MTIAIDERSRSTAQFPVTTLVWIALLSSSLLLYVRPDLFPSAVRFPDAAVIPLSDWVSVVMRWLRENLSWLTRGITDILSIPLNWSFNLLAKGWKLGPAADAAVFPRLSWVGIVAAFVLAGYKFGGTRLAALAAGCMLYIALFGQWESSMLTLALIVISVPLCIALGLAFGILAYRRPWIDDALISPLLDLMQTMPTFAYLIPMLLLFGNSPVSAMIATVIFSMPPMVRATKLALQRVPSEIKDFADMAGCTRRQKLWRVELPAGRPGLMVGVNQVIMLALNMVIISSMIGAGGLGYDVLLALRALKIGQSMEAGMAIVALAIVLDRLSQAAAMQRPAAVAASGALWHRYPVSSAIVTVLVATTLIGTLVPAFTSVPSAITVSTAPAWKTAVDWITVNFFDVIEVFRTTLLLYVLNPVRAFFEKFPWLAAVALLGMAGYQIRGPRLAMLVMALSLFCVVTGLWEKTMATVYLCGISAIMAALLGLPLGLLASRSDRFQNFITPVIDTLQTLPSFCFIIPVVMLFRVGDVTAMIATVLFAIVPAIRYTNHGIRQIPPALIEAAAVAGCTSRQMFWRVQLPLALPEIMLGLNQTLLLALSMIIICAMIGTRDLGQEVFIALAKADAGRGIVAGLAIAFIGIIADRLVGGSAAKMQSRLGIA
jgi:glycine betaine/proline transport system permease protein